MCQRLCDLAHQTRLTLQWYSSFQALTRFKVPVQISLIAQTHDPFPLPCERRVSTWTLYGGRLAPRRANERYTSEPATLARLICQAYHRHPGRTRLSPPPASTRSLLMPTEQGRSTPSPVQRKSRAVPPFLPRLSADPLMDLIPKRSFYMGVSFNGNGAVCSKATGLTYCNVECKRTGL